MARRSGLKRLRTLVPWTLMVMIVMRLIWIQLRDFQLEPTPRGQASAELASRALDRSCDALAQPGRGLKALTPPSPLGMLGLAGHRVDAPGERARLALGAQLASPALVAFWTLVCQLSPHDERAIIRANQGLLLIIVFLAALLSRFLTSSWTVGLIVAVVLLSRGRLVAAVGSSGGDLLVMLALVTFMAAAAHFLRTGARFSLWMMALVGLAAATADRSLTCLTLALPVLLVGGYVGRRRLARPLLSRWRRMRRSSALGRFPVQTPVPVQTALAQAGRALRLALGAEPAPAEPMGDRPTSDQRGGIFATLSVPFLVWAYRDRRWFRLTMAFFVVCAMAIATNVLWAAALTQGDPFGGLLPAELAWTTARGAAKLLTFGRAAIDVRDLHLIVSFGIIALCAMQSPAAGLPSFLEAAIMATAAALLTLLGASVADSVDRAWITHVAVASAADVPARATETRSVVLWLDPLILTMGVAGLYNLAMIIDRRRAR